eukprot:Rmarinus@m.24152
MLIKRGVGGAIVSYMKFYADSGSFDDLCSAFDDEEFSCVRYICIVTKGRLTYETDYDGRTVFHCCADLGHLDVIRYFVEEKGAADLISKANEDGETVLHHATWGGHLDVIRYFVEKGTPDLCNVICINGRTVLHEAACYGHVDIVRYFR